MLPAFILKRQLLNLHIKYWIFNKKKNKSTFTFNDKWSRRVSDNKCIWRIRASSSLGTLHDKHTHSVSFCANRQTEERQYALLRKLAIVKIMDHKRV